MPVTGILMQTFTNASNVYDSYIAFDYRASEATVINVVLSLFIKKPQVSKDNI